MRFAREGSGGHGVDEAVFIQQDGEIIDVRNFIMVAELHTNSIAPRNMDCGLDQISQTDLRELTGQILRFIVIQSGLEKIIR